MRDNLLALETTDMTIFDLVTCKTAINRNGQTNIHIVEDLCLPGLKFSHETTDVNHSGGFLSGAKNLHGPGIYVSFLEDISIAFVFLIFDFLRYKIYRLIKIHQLIIISQIADQRLFLRQRRPCQIHFIVDLGA